MNKPRRYSRHLLTCAFALALATFQLLAAQTLENDRFSVSLAKDGTLKVIDKSANATWSQPSSKINIRNATRKGDAITFTVNKTFNATVTLDPTGVDLSIEGPAGTTIEGLNWPTGFRMANASQTQKLVLPNCAGIVVPFADRNQPDLAKVKGKYETWNSQRGLSMPWIGVTDDQRGSYMLIKTPFDVEMDVWDDAEGYAFSSFWHDSHQQFNYTRKVRYEFVSEGGIVALCKRYRQHAEETGLLVTLKEKRKAAPQLDQFLGAISFWVIDWPDIDLLKQMKADGIERALINYHSTEGFPEGTVNRIGKNITYEPMDMEFTDRLHELGYLAGRYDYYRTIYPPNDPGLQTTEGNLWIMRMIGYPEQLAKNPDGSIVPGFGARGATSDELIRGHRCSKCQADMALAYIPLDLQRTGYDARLLDAVCAVEWKECYDPEHPVTREQDMLHRKNQLSIPTRFGQITGTEGLASWAVPTTIYGEGPTTFTRYFPRIGGQQLKPTPRDMPDEYREVVLNERLRAPLWQLVFHDATIITNRWNITANRYTDESYWDQEDLINLLHGQMPTFLTTKEDYAKTGKRIAETFKTVCDWNSKIGYEEMTNFEWLTEDATVQKVTYESGRSVIVNFGKKSHKLANGDIVKGRNYRFED